MNSPRFLSAWALVLGALPLASALADTAKEKPILGQSSGHQASVADQWLEVALESTANDVDRNGPRPTVLSRTLAMAVTAMYDAWAAYDDKAVGTRLGAAIRRPAAERTAENRQTAISYATYRVLLDVHPEDKDYLTAELKKYGLDPAVTTTDPSTAAGVGNAVAKALLDYRHHDGANQLGKEEGSNGKPYSDWTFYKPVNTPTKINDPDLWQEIPWSDGKGGQKVVPFLTPHWYRVKPFALTSGSQFRPPPQPLVGSAQLKQEVDECIELNAKLTPRNKAIVEFMRDGPRSTGQSGHWLKFAQLVSRRDKQDLEKDVKLYFTVGNLAMDAFIAAWEAKRYYDTSRPWTLIRHYYKGQDIQGWGGPDKGTVTLKGDDWLPYSPATFVTPPFPGYVSGHSCVSAASAKALEYFTGSDHFGVQEVRKCCVLTETPGEEITLDLPTFTATAEMAGISRVMGGYHIQADNVAGLKLGRDVAAYCWPKVQAYFEGTAEIRE